MSADPFAVLAASADPAMVVVTSVHDGERAGCLVGFHAQSSIEPTRYCIWLSKANHTGRIVQRASTLAVHFLADGQHDVAELFGTLSGDDVDKFARCAWDEGPAGVPLLADVPRRLVAHRVAVLDEGGDHLCVITEPFAVAADGPFTPLRLSAVSDLDAAHEAEERPSPPTERAD